MCGGSSSVAAKDHVAFLLSDKVHSGWMGHNTFDCNVGDSCLLQSKLFFF